MTTLHAFKVGDRVKLLRDVDRFPDFIAHKGATGTVCCVEINGDLAVTMDDHIDGAEEWDNDIGWYDVYSDDIVDDLELVPEGSS